MRLQELRIGSIFRFTAAGARLAVERGVPIEGWETKTYVLDEPDEYYHYFHSVDHPDNRDYRHFGDYEVELV